MRTFITSDLQLSGSPRDSYRFDFFHRLPSLLLRQNCQRLIIAGDLTEQKDNHGAWLVNQIVRGLAKIPGYVIILKGNHDYLEADSPFFEFLSEIKQIKFISTPTLLGDELFLPHTRDYAHDWQGIERFKPKRIFAHNTFKGALGANGVMLDGIPLSVLPNVPVIAGDIHTPQRLGRLTYIGAPYLCNFGDDYEPRALILDGDKLLSLKLRGPQKRLIYADSVERAKAEFARMNAYDVVRVRFLLPQSDYPLWPEIQADIRALAAHKQFILDSVLPEVQASNKPVAQRRHSGPVNDEQLLKTYGQNRQLDKQTLETGLELL